MAQIVIFAPEGEDVSAGEQALKDAGHDVEIVEATPENLMHMAIGMLEHHSSKKDEEPKDEPPADETDPLADPAPEEEEPPAEEDPKKMEAVDRVISIEGERVPAVKGKASMLYVAEGTVGERTTFMLNEMQHTIWSNTFRCNLKVEGQALQQLRVPVVTSKFGQTYFVAGPELHHLF